MECSESRRRKNIVKKYVSTILENEMRLTIYDIEEEGRKIT